MSGLSVYDINMPMDVWGGTWTCNLEGVSMSIIKTPAAVISYLNFEEILQALAVAFRSFEIPDVTFGIYSRIPQYHIAEGIITWNRRPNNSTLVS